jgi:hypothetical protein
MLLFLEGVFWSESFLGSRARIQLGFHINLPLQNLCTDFQENFGDDVQEGLPKGIFLAQYFHGDKVAYQESLANGEFMETMSHTNAGAKIYCCWESFKTVRRAGMREEDTIAGSIIHKCSLKI